jgi:hypothetical protein
MLRDGEYAVWFKTPGGEGTGIIFLVNGKIAGGDSVLSYSGRYEVNEDRFTATLSTKRFAAGHPSLFGIDEIELKLTGHVNGMTASCSGKAEQVPELPFRATLIRVQDQPSGSTASAGKRKSAHPTIEPRRLHPAMTSR